MIYCYRCSRCEQGQSQEFRIGTAPEIIACPCGYTAERDFAAEKAGPASAQIANDMKYPYVSHRLPSTIEGCPKDKRGKPVIVSKRHEAEIMAKYNYSRE